MNQFQRTLEALTSTTRAGFDAQMEAIAFLKHFRWENLSPEAMLKILEVIKEETK